MNKPFRNNSDKYSKNKPSRGNSRGRAETADDDGPIHIYGYHACEAVLKNPARRIHKAYMSKNMSDRLIGEGIDLPKGWNELRPREMDGLVDRDAVHQGIILEVDQIEQPTLEEVRHHELVLILDQITDPHNVGAIMRSACALGAGAVVTTKRNAPNESGLLAKTASGAFDLLPYIQVTNLARAIEEIRTLGFFAIGLDSEGPSDLVETIASIKKIDKIALILGAEGSGLRRLTRDNCDALARLDMAGPIKSLNVSNAAALSMFICKQSLSPADA